MVQDDPVLEYGLLLEVEVEDKINERQVQHGFQRLLAILNLLLFILESPADSISCFGGHEPLVLLLERVVVEGDPVTKIPADIHEATHEERRHLFRLQLMLAELVDVDERVSCLR